MAKIAIIGAGSMVFATKIVGDILSFPALSDSTVALMDIDADRLRATTRAAEGMVDREDLDATIESTTDRREALDDADYVLCTITVGGTEPFENEIRIPERYGVKQAIGDTLGPGGIFRGLRTIPTLLDIAADMEELCPHAILLNYTNPMAICCWAVEAATEVDVVGLCHSVPHTVEAIAEYTDSPADELEYWVAGINHVAWVLELTHDGDDLYPALREAGHDPEIYDRDTVRFELLEHFGHFVTESSHHASEYLPYFRTDEDRIDELTGTGYAERMATASYLEGWKARSADRDADRDDFDPEDATVERSEEYASRLIHSMETDTTRRLTLNVPGNPSIDNLPEAACVEVPCLVDGTGVHPCHVGTLPPQLATICRTNVNVQELAVRGALEKDRSAVRHAVALDPLTSAELSLDEIHELTEELIEANAQYLPTLE
jgi:alpha-galactosidase